MVFVTCFMHVCLTIKYYKIMGGDKIVLLDGAGANGGGAGAIVKNMIPAFPFFPFGKKGIKKCYTGRRAIEYPWPVCFT